MVIFRILLCIKDLQEVTYENWKIHTKRIHLRASDGKGSHCICNNFHPFILPLPENGEEVKFDST